MNTLQMKLFQNHTQGNILPGLFVVVFFMVVWVSSVGQSLAASQQEFDYSSTSLRVGVWIDGLDEGDVLERGEEISVGFQTNEDSYAVVYRINTEGAVTVLWPRSRLDDGFVFGGHEYFMPVTGGRRVVASSKSGEGFIEAIVSRYPFDLRDLAVDFHHEFEAENYNFAITGDPFLAINEVNFAITGMEDSDDFVVTNYLGYYVHEVVEHPRYLCGQCHTDDDVAVDPYRDQCTIDIQYDYAWGNDWYDSYGYYPVYHNPVYVYVDPWTYQPWVNFWYEPYYRCAYSPGYNWSYSVCSWNYSPHYNNYGSRKKSGRGLYQPPVRQSGQLSPSRYGNVTGQIRKPSGTDRERQVLAIGQRNTRDVSRSIRGDQARRTSESPSVVRGEKPKSRTRPSIDKPARGASRGGLQIRPGGSRNNQTRTGAVQVRDRNEQGVLRTLPAPSPRNSNPGRGSSVGGVSGNSTVHNRSGGGTNRNAGVKPSSGANTDGRIKPVKPRKNGTRIWNSGSGSQGSTRNSDRSVEPRRNTRGDRSSGSAVKPRSNSRQSNTRSGGSTTVKPKSNSRSNSSSNSRNSGSNVKKSGSKKSNSSSSSSSGSRSSGSSSSKKSSSGKSKSGGGSSRSGKSGGSSGRR